MGSGRFVPVLVWPSSDCFENDVPLAGSAFDLGRVTCSRGLKRGQQDCCRRLWRGRPKPGLPLLHRRVEPSEHAVEGAAIGPHDDVVEARFAEPPPTTQSVRAILLDRQMGVTTGSVVRRGELVCITCRAGRWGAFIATDSVFESRAPRRIVSLH